MKICVVSDAWFPQTNGVVRTLDTSIKIIESLGHEVLVIHPGLFPSFTYPPYPDIRIPIHTWGMLKRIRKFCPDAIHIATEGRLGLKVRNWCVRNGRPFTTSYHTKFPEYLEDHFGIPSKWTYAYLKWFHGKASRTMANTPSLKSDLEGRGFKNLVLWGRGVDLSLFRPRKKTLNFPSPVWVNVGRVSSEKNIEEFLKLDLPGTKVVVGDGPQRKELEAKYPEVKFLGMKKGEDLAQAYNEGDVFVFPSKTDTFGLVMLEAMACGLPIAAYPVTGPIDVVKDGETGFLRNDLKDACLSALSLDSNHVAESAQEFTWGKCTADFVNNLVR